MIYIYSYKGTIITILSIVILLSITSMTYHCDKLDDNSLDGFGGVKLQIYHFSQREVISRNSDE